MYPALHAAIYPDKAAIVMGRSGQRLSYRELDERSAQLAPDAVASAAFAPETSWRCSPRTILDTLRSTGAAMRSGPDRTWPPSRPQVSSAALRGEDRDATASAAGGSLVQLSAAGPTVPMTIAALSG